jgi:hypothetical protein
MQSFSNPATAVSLNSNTFSHCVATPGNQDGLAMELRFCINTPALQWSRPAG